MIIVDKRTSKGIAWSIYECEPGDVVQSLEADGDILYVVDEGRVVLLRTSELYDRADYSDEKFTKLNARVVIE